jgi:MerR family transcriptional regulator, multidrug-efflux activator
MAYTVQGLATMAGITVRTLHHYDSIGLLRPQSHTQSGYRQYGPEELERLQQILFFRELDFPLEDIKEILDKPSFDRSRALEQHRELLKLRMSRLQNLLDTVDNTLKTIQGGTKMQDKELFESFDMTEIEEHKAKYAEEVDAKYPGWQQRDKTKHYGKKEWAEVTRVGGEIQTDLARLMEEGRSPSDPAVQAVIARHHAYIDKYFYTCPMEIYTGLGELYVADERFTKNIDKVKPGLAAFQSAAIKVYSETKK